MRHVTLARWACCALALSICTPALADKAGRGAHKTLADCTAFDQADKGEAEVEFILHNSCSVPIECAITWQVTCAPTSHKRRSVHPGAAKLALVEQTTQSTSTSAQVCGDDSWAIENVNWSCAPSKE
jgi:hypothetical protein